jgi:hypothetical protein
MSRTFMQTTKVLWPFIQLLMEHFLAGELPARKHKLVVAWIEIHQDDLLADWNLAVDGKKPFTIKGLDQ